MSAFAQDVVKKRYADFPELLDYCRRSANPVGRLVLLLHGFSDEERFAMSDDICTALQLANFWGATESEIFADSAGARVREIVKFQVERTRKLFDRGEKLPSLLPFPLSLEIRATLAGGRAILDKIESQGFDTLSKRPAFGRLDKLRILIRALAS